MKIIGIKAIISIFVGCILATGCDAFGPAYQYYAFSYELRRAPDHVAVLAYKLWAGDTIIARFEPSVNQQRSYVEDISPRNIGPVPQFLYVRWIDEATSQVFEDTADLRPNMPTRLDGDVVYFTLSENRLRVYLVKSGSKASNPTPQLSPYATDESKTLYSGKPAPSIRKQLR